MYIFERVIPVPMDILKQATIFFKHAPKARAPSGGSIWHLHLHGGAI